MGRIGQLLSFVRVALTSAKVSDVKIDRGGGDTRTLQHFSDAGDDSFPLPNDFVQTVDQAGSGRDSAVGYVDPKNDQKANAGEKRIYARDANSGVTVVEVWLKNDGTAIISNGNGSFTLNPDGSQKGQNAAGSFELQANGDFVVNGFKVAANGNVTSPNSLVLNGRDLNDHTHPIIGGSSAPGPTGINN